MAILKCDFEIDGVMLSAVEEVPAVKRTAADLTVHLASGETPRRTVVPFDEEDSEDMTMSEDYDFNLDYQGFDDGDGDNYSVKEKDTTAIREADSDDFFEDLLSWRGRNFRRGSRSRWRSSAG
jgi:hypothetical protein